MPKGANWVHEVKFDGYRGLAYIENGQARIYTRTGQDWTEKFTPLAAELETPEGRTKENIEAQFTTLAGSMVSWNLDDDDGKPISCDYEGLRVQDFDFVMKIMLGWMQAISSVPESLGKDSNSGGTSPEASLGLASVSRSQAS